MDVNKGRFAEIFPVVTTVYKSTSSMGFMAVLMVLHYHKCEPLIFQRFFIISFLADSGAFVLKVSLFVFLLPFSVVWSITQEFDSCNISSNLIGAVLPFMGNLKRK